MQGPICVVVRLWIREGAMHEFEAYERNAARIMRRHGGTIERAIRVTQRNASDDPFEIHIVTFPGEKELADYRADPEREPFSAQREASILKTEAVVGIDLPAYTT